MYYIESGIPLPVKPKHRRPNTRTPTALAYYTYMNIGDSALFPTFNQAKSVWNLLRKEGYKATMKTIVHNEAYRVWRVK